MISTPVNNAALLILRQANASNSTTTNEQTTAADSIIATVNGVSSENSPGKTKASSTINSALLDVKEKQDSNVQAALDFLDSDLFQSSDPTVKDTLKKLISENGEEFARQIQAQQAAHSGISLENAIANALGATIENNRDSFGDGEFTVGFKFSGGGSIISNVADKNGNSTYQSLMDSYKSERSARMQSTREALQDGQSPLDAGALQDSPANQALQDWSNKWYKEFGIEA